MCKNIYVWIVFICFGCFNKLPNNWNLFPKVLKTGKFKIMVLADLVSVKWWLPGLKTAILLLCPYVEEKNKGTLWGLFHKGIKALHSEVLHPPDLIPSHWGSSYQHEFWGGYIQFIHLENTRNNVEERWESLSYTPALSSESNRLSWVCKMNSRQGKLSKSAFLF